MRAFIAIDLSGSLRQKLAAHSQKLQSRLPSHAIRWARPEAIHLTLKFLGEVETTRLETVEGILTQVANRWTKFSFLVEGFGCFPNVARPRVIWVGVREASGTLERLQTDVESEMARIGFVSEGRRFHPHLTLGRVRDRASKDQREAISRGLSEIEAVAIGEQTVEAVTLFRSDLRPSGAVYTPLLIAPLGDPG